MDVKTKLTVVILSLYIHKTISCTPNMNTTFYVNSISVKLGENQGRRLQQSLSWKLAEVTFIVTVWLTVASELKQSVLGFGWLGHIDGRALPNVITWSADHVFLHFVISVSPV